MRAINKTSVYLNNESNYKFKRPFHVKNNTNNGRVFCHEKLCLSSLKSIEIINIKDIMYLKSDSNYTTLYKVNNEQFTVSKTLKNFEEDLENQICFVRVHKSYIVNINYVIRLLKEYNGSLVLENGTEIPISKDKKKEIFSLFYSS